MVGRKAYNSMTLESDVIQRLSELKAKMNAMPDRHFTYSDVLGVLLTVFENSKVDISVPDANTIELVTIVPGKDDS